MLGAGEKNVQGESIDYAGAARDAGELLEAIGFVARQPFQRKNDLLQLTLLHRFDGGKTEAEPRRDAGFVLAGHGAALADVQQLCGHFELAIFAQLNAQLFEGIATVRPSGSASSSSTPTPPSDRSCRRKRAVLPSGHWLWQ